MPKTGFLTHNFWLQIC